MPLYSTFLPVGSTVTPPRVIVPSCVPRAVHSWTTRSSRMYWRRPSKLRSGKTEKMRRIAEPICSRPTFTSPVTWFSKTEVVGVHGDDRVDVVRVPGVVVAVDVLV